MRKDLVELLRDRPVCHPSRITTTTLETRELRVRVLGWPWWSDHTDQNRSHGIELIFGGVGDGVLEPFDFCSEYDEDDEALEQFSVVSTDDLPWAQRRGSEIYCNAPLPKPLEVYLSVHDFLASQGAFRPAARYFNCPDSELLDPFIRLTQTSSYLLGRFPSAIRDLVCAELDAQKVSYTQLPVALEKPGRLFVTIQRSQFFCETAEAVFEG